jgi:hypothetical protein
MSNDVVCNFAEITLAAEIKVMMKPHARVTSQSSVVDE